MSRFKGTPRGGLPGPLPAGEDLLWQGAPTFWALAKYAFRVQIVGAYFGFLILLRVGAALVEGDPLKFSLGTGVTGLWLGAAALGMFCVLSSLIARSTTYTITSKRVVITYCMALPKSINLPYVRIDAADMKVNADGTGDIALKLPEKTRLSYVLLWPHVRSGVKGRAEPVLRCISGPQAAAETLAGALANTIAQGERAVTAKPEMSDLNVMTAQAA